jgi:hypothetical protein
MITLAEDWSTVHLQIMLPLGVGTCVLREEGLEERFYQVEALAWLYFA